MKHVLHWLPRVVLFIYRVSVLFLLWVIGARILSVDDTTISILQSQNEEMRATLSDAANAYQSIRNERDELKRENLNLLLSNPFKP